VIGAVARDDPAARLAGGRPRELDGVLIGIGAAQGEEHAPAAEARAFEEERREPRARLRTPGARDETELLGLSADCGNHARVLMAEIAAFGETRHVEDRAAIGREEPRPLTPHDGRGIPLVLHAPTVEHRLSLGEARNGGLRCVGEHCGIIVVLLSNSNSHSE